MIPEFGTPDKLRKARECTGMDRMTFADAIGVSRNTVQNAELGKTTPLRAVLKAWSDMSGVPLWWILGEPGPAVDAGALGLPRLDSNQQPADYLRVASVTSLDEKIRVASRVQKVTAITDHGPVSLDARRRATRAHPRTGGTEQAAA